MRWIVLLLVVITAACVSPVNYIYNKSNDMGQIIPPIQPPKQNPDDGGVGSLNHQYLQATHPKIIIEIDYVSGYEPTSATKNAVANFFNDIAGKQVSFSGSNAIAAAKNVYSVSDLLEIEKENRNHYTTSDTAVVYITSVNGAFENSGALGVVYKASTIALFPDRMNEATSALVFYSQIEKAVALHELGHLMGLVNINYRSERNHEDSNHPAHSKNDNSVMFWAVEDISLKQLLRFGPPTEYDDDDLFDLQKIREGVY